MDLKKRSKRQSKKEHSKSYEDHLIVEKFSPSTIKAYQLGLRQFLEFKELHSIAGDLDQDQARQFILTNITRLIMERMYTAIKIKNTQ